MSEDGRNSDASQIPWVALLGSLNQREQPLSLSLCILGLLEMQANRRSSKRHHSEKKVGVLRAYEAFSPACFSFSNVEGWGSSESCGSSAQP